MTTLKLEDFGITQEFGFLSPYPMDEVTLPEAFKEIEEAGKNLSALITSGRVCTYLDQLPEVDIDQHLDALSDAQLRMLMVRYSFIIQAYVWGEEKPATTLKRNLAVPYCKLAKKLDQFPLLPYSAYALDNWAKLDKNGPVVLENIYVLQNFLGGLDENWFILDHVEIEAKAGKALGAIPDILEAIKADDLAAVTTHLKKVQTAWESMNPVFDRMVENCDPYIYFNRVRPYIHGWKDNPALPGGIVYEGVEEFDGKVMAFRGQTGSQSSIVPTMDALLCIAHDGDPLREYLDELHAYRPTGHRLFIEEIQKRSTLREFVQQTNDTTLTNIYNECVDNVRKFRARHLEYAARYINKQSANKEGNDTEVGTGGTPFMKYLKKHRDESAKHAL